MATSSRVKIQKLEIWDNDLPTTCMVCGVKPGTTKADTVAVYVPFPLSLLGILGKAISWKKIPFPIVTCNDCKGGYDNEENMTKLFGLMYSLAFFSLFYPVSTRNGKDLLVPLIAYIIVIVLHGVYFWTIGKNSAIRCVGMDHGNVAFEFPGGHWGVEYTKFRREKVDRRLGRGHGPANPAPVAQGEGADQGPPPPGAPNMGSGGGGGPASQATSGGGGIPLEGDGNARVPDTLPELLTAVKEGDMDKVTRLLNDGGDAFECTDTGMNGLHIACVSGLMQMADLMIKRGVDANSEMDGGLTPMHLAVQSNNQSIVGLLLAKKGNPNYKNHQGLTPLHWCGGVRDERLDPANRFKMAQVLVKGGGDIKMRDKQGRTPAEIALEGGEGKVAEAFS
jgi:hypothetical protein